MMEIIVKRERKYREMLHGRLWIDGDHVCDTLERADSCLPPSTYRMEKASLPFVASNGVHTLGKNQMAVGEWMYLGFIIHTQQALAALKDRLRKSLFRHGEVLLRVEAEMEP